VWWLSGDVVAFVGILCSSGDWGCGGTVGMWWLGGELVALWIFEVLVGMWWFSGDVVALLIVYNFNLTFNFFLFNLFSNNFTTCCS
jgi:hypothetical protein